MWYFGEMQAENEYIRNDRRTIQALLSDYGRNGTRKDFRSPIYKNLIALEKDDAFFDNDRLNEAGKKLLNELVQKYYRKKSAVTTKKDVQLLRVLNNIYIKGKVDAYRELDSRGYAPKDVGIQSGINKVTLLNMINKSKKPKRYFVKNPNNPEKSLFSARLHRCFLQGNPEMKVLGKQDDLTSKDVGSIDFNEDKHKELILNQAGTGFAELMMLAMVTGETDLHGSNIRVDNLGHMIRIDYDATFGNTFNKNIGDFDFDKMNFTAVIPRIPINDGKFMIKLGQSTQFKNEMFKALVKLCIYPTKLIEQHEVDAKIKLIQLGTPAGKRYEGGEQKNKARLTEMIFSPRLKEVLEIAMNNDDFAEYLKVADIDGIIMELEVCEDGKAAARLADHTEDMRNDFHEIKKRVLGKDVAIEPSKIVDSDSLNLKESTMSVGEAYEFMKKNVKRRAATYDKAMELDDKTLDDTIKFVEDKISKSFRLLSKTDTNILETLNKVKNDRARSLDSEAEMNKSI